MARERIVIKKIEKKAARHVTFSKRRRGLTKKAEELSILCEADVALIIFSATGKLFEYSSSGMRIILEKYSKLSNTTQNDRQFHPEVENQDVRRMKQELEYVSNTLRHMHGEDLEGLTIKDLQQLENKLTVALNHVRTKKDESLFRKILQLQTQGIQYVEENAKLRLQLNERECCHVDNKNGEESLVMEPLETQSSESTVCTANNLDVHKTSIKEYEASDPCLQLGLSI